MEKKKSENNLLFSKKESEYEYHIFQCPKRMRREMNKIFPKQFGKEGTEDVEELKLIIYFQKSRYDLICYGEKSESEKERCWNHLFEMIKSIKKSVELLDKPNWLDFTDPANGFPFYSERGGFQYNDLEGIQSTLKYQMIQAGGCCVFLHPIWSTNVYPSTIFTTVETTKIQNVLEEYFSKIKSSSN